MTDKMKNIVVIVVFMAVITIVLIANLIKEDTLISETERRKLTAFPKLTIATLFDGSFTDTLEKYTMDQFIKRDSFRSIKTFFELYVLGKKDVNDVYLYNGTIVKQEYPLNEKSVQNVANKMNYIKNKYLTEANSVYYSIVPDKNYYVDDEYLKMDYVKLEQIMSENLQDMQYINIFDSLTLDDYYYTDPHWKQENLNRVVCKIATEMGFYDRIKTKFYTQDIVEFRGSYSGQLQVQTQNDTIRVLTNEIIQSSTVYNYETNENTQIYNLEKLSSSDKYDIYLSGATPLLTIENENATTNKELIVFRDSFGSSLVPLFTEAYKKITLIDTRYIATKLLGDYVNFENADVLFIYSTLVINNSSTLK
jgi:hypothetical protein